MKITRQLSIIPAVCMLLSFAACGKSGEHNADTQATPVPEYSYSAKTVLSHTSTRENAVAAEPAVITDNGYYAIGAEFTDGEIPEGAVEEYEDQFSVRIPCLSFVNLDGSVDALSAYSPVSAETDGEGKRDFRITNSIQGLWMNSEGQLVCAETVYASWTDAGKDVQYGTEDYYKGFQAENTMYIRVLNTDGSEISRSRVEVEDPDSLSMYISAIDSEDNLVVASDTAFTAYNMEGKEAYSIPVDGYAYSLATTKDGRTAAMLYDITSYKLSVRIIDPKSGCFTDKTYSAGATATSLISGSGEYDLFASSGSTVYGVNLEDGTSEKLFSWLDCDLVGDRMQKLSSSDGVITGFNSESNEASGEYTTELIRVERTPFDPSVQKKVLTMATLYMDDNMMAEVIKFNRSHDDVRIRVTDYSEYNTDEDYSAGLTKLTTELIAGNIPDILDMSADLPYMRYAASGLLVDLYPYIDADKELDREDLFSNVLKALEVNGGLYTACPGFCVYTAVGASSVIGDEPGLTYQQYFDALASMPEGCEGFEKGMDKNTILSMSLALEQHRFIDWKTGKCSFDSPEFIQMLEYANTFPKSLGDDYVADADDSSNARISRGEQMLSQAIFTSVDYIMDDYDRLFGGKCTVAGFPTSEGVGSMIVLTNGLSITNACSDKDAAWEFVRSFLTEDYQSKLYYLPVNRNVFDEKLEKAMEEKYETDENGNILLDENGEKKRQPIGYYYDGLQQVAVFSINESQTEILRTAIATATRLMNFDQSIDDIVTDGAAPFFAGQKTADECAKIIQSKANIYVNEQR